MPFIFWLLLLEIITSQAYDSPTPPIVFFFLRLWSSPPSSAVVPGRSLVFPRGTPTLPSPCFGIVAIRFQQHKANEGFCLNIETPKIRRRYWYSFCPSRGGRGLQTPPRPLAGNLHEKEKCIHIEGKRYMYKCFSLFWKSYFTVGVWSIKLSLGQMGRLVALNPSYIGSMIYNINKHQCVVDT